MYVAKDAILELAGHLDNKDPESSSHWTEMHRNFRYGPAGFSGLVGFGDYAPPKSVLHRLVHHIFQIPFRRMGRGFSTFPVEYRNIKTIAARQNRQLNVDMLRQALSLALLRQKIGDEPFRQTIVIGDGFGTMAALILLGIQKTKVVLVNLTKTLLVDLVYLQRALPQCGFALVRTPADYSAALENPGIVAVAVEAVNAELLKNSCIPVCINIASMQEMNPSVTAAYFRHMREAPGAETVFYCCNRLEKEFPDGTVVRFHDYPWRQDDETLVNEACPWHQFFYQPIPPFYRPYDGTVWHQLSILRKASQP
jgi:hypothetical protein